MSISTATPAYLQQRHDALQAANGVRTHRAEMKELIRGGDLSVSKVLMDPPSYAVTMPVFDLLRCQVNWGQAKAGRLLKVFAVSHSRSVADLSDRQRAGLVAMLGRLRGEA